MSIYQQQLQDFLTSDDFSLVLWDMSRWIYLQVGVCGPEKFKFETEFYRSCRERYQREGEIQLSLPDETIKECFRKSDLYHRSAILVAHWLGFSRSKIKRIYQARNGGYSAWSRLFDYVSPAHKIYIVSTETGEIRANIEGDSLMLIAENGQRYEISL